MEYLTSVILSGVIYDLLKNGLTVTSNTLRESLKGWIFKEGELVALASHVNQIENVEELSESAIAKRLDKNLNLQSILTNFHQDNSTKTVTQSHSGIGHNFGGNVSIINNK